MYASTCEIYADACSEELISVPTPENISVLFKDPHNLRWSYAASKYLGELAVIAAHKEHNQDYQIIRYHNIYGPGQVDHFIPEFVERVKNGDGSLYGWENTRSFCYIDDAIEASFSLLKNKKARNRTIHLGTEDEVSIKEVAEMILQILSLKTELLLKDSPEGSAKRRCPNIGLMNSLIEFKPQTSLKEGLEKTIRSIN